MKIFVHHGVLSGGTGRGSRGMEVSMGMGAGIAEGTIAVCKTPLIAPPPTTEDTSTIIKSRIHFVLFEPSWLSWF
jgi:hypothetical protein